MEKIISSIMAKQEKKSWKEEKFINYEVGIMKRESNGSVAGFWRTFRNQSTEFPRGLTREDALRLGDRVYETQVTRKRIK